MPVTIHEFACVGCAACVNSCPTDVIRMGADKNRPVIAYPDDCQECFLCELDCPVDAIIVTTRRLSERELAQLSLKLAQRVSLGIA